MADTSGVVERVADRFVKQLTNAFEAALAAGASSIDVSALAGAIERGSRTAAQDIAERAEDADHLRVLARRQPLEDHLLDVAEASANATRCMVRPTATPEGTPAERLRPTARDAQTANELAVQQVETNLRSPMSPRGAPPERQLRAASAGEEMVDTLVRIGVAMHGINVHVFMDGGSHRISVPLRMRRRLERWSRESGIALHTVALDRRAEATYSGHGYYHQRGIRSTTLDKMTKVSSAQHLRDLVRG